MTPTAATLDYATNLVRNTEDYLLATVGPIFLVEWRRDTSVEGCSALLRESKLLADVWPSGIGLLTVVQASAPPPDQKQRQAMADTLRGVSDYVRCSAVVVEGDGFRAAFVRGVATGLTLLARQKFPHHVKSMANAAATFAELFEPERDTRVTAKAIERYVAETRQRAHQALARTPGAAA